MITYQVKKATTDVSVVIRIIDSTDGTPETAVTSATAGLDLEYRREGATSVDISEVGVASLSNAHSDGAIIHIGNGYYRLDLPDAACNTGSTGCLVHGTVTGMIVIGCYVQLVDNIESDTYGIVTGGVVVSAGSKTGYTLVPGDSTVMLSGTTHTGAIIPSAAVINTVNDKTGYSVSVLTTKVTAATVDDKTGYTLSPGGSTVMLSGVTHTGAVIPSAAVVNTIGIGGITSAAVADNAFDAATFAAGTLKIRKNTALANFMFIMIDSADHVSAKTGLTVAAARSIDGAAFASCANSVAEITNGWYKIDLAATDLNGDVIALKFTASGADATNITIFTEA